jgi:hypothetical protein
LKITTVIQCLQQLEIDTYKITVEIRDANAAEILPKNV